MAIIEYSKRNPGVRPSELDREVGIKTFIPNIDSTTGYDLGTWLSPVTVRAKVIEIDESKEMIEHGGVIYKKIIRVIVRYDPSFETSLIKVVYKNEEYEVDRVREVYGRRRFLIMKAYQKARGNS